MFLNLYAWVLKHPWRTLALLLPWVLLSAAGLPKTKIMSDFEVFFHPSDPNLATYQDLNVSFTKPDNVLFIVSPEDGQVFSKKMLIALYEFTEQAELLPHSIRVDSITNFQHSAADEDSIEIDDLIWGPGFLDPERVELAREVALSEPQLLDRLISPSGHVAGVNVTFHLDSGTTRNEQLTELVAESRALAMAMEAKYPFLDVRLNGVIMNNNAFREASLGDLKNIVPVAFVIAIGLLAMYIFLVSASWVATLTGTFGTLMVVVTSILIAQGLASWCGILLSPPVANAPTMILTLAIADSVHIMTTFYQRLRRGESRRDAMAESLRINHQPVFLTSVTTILGFLTLNFSDAPPFNDLGNVVAVGVLAAWLMSVLLLPALLVVLPASVKEGKAWDFGLERLAGAVMRRPALCLAGSIVVMSVAMIGIVHNEINDVWAEYFDESVEHRRDSEYMREHLTTNNIISFAVGAGKENGISNPEYLRRVAAFAVWLSEQPDVVYVDSFLDTLKRLNKTMHADDPEWYRLPDRSDLAMSYIWTLEASGVDLSHHIDSRKSMMRVTAGLDNSSTARALDIQKRAQEWLRAHGDDAFFHPGTSPDVMFAHIGHSNIKSMIQGTVIALLLISAILVVAFRSFRFGVLSLLPNMLPAATAFGLWGWYVGEIGLGLSVVSGMTLGIVVDYSVHFISKYLRAVREQKLNAIEGVHYAFSTVGVALLVTTVILCANFAVLSQSGFALNADMGILTAVTILIALVVDFVFLPPLLLVLGASRAKSNESVT